MADSRTNVLGLRGLLADLLPAFSAASSVQVFNDEAPSQFADPDTTAKPPSHSYRGAVTDQRRRSIQISIPVILEGVPEPTPADSEAANGGEPSLSDPHSPEARDEEDGSLPADASVLLSSTGLIATRASSVGGRPTLGAQGIAAITPGGGLGRARVRATQQRRGSTGAPIALKSPMFSPITLVTNAANAALHGAAPAFSLGSDGTLESMHALSPDYYSTTGNGSGSGSAVRLEGLPPRPSTTTNAASSAGLGGGMRRRRSSLLAFVAATHNTGGATGTGPITAASGAVGAAVGNGMITGVGGGMSMSSGRRASEASFASVAPEMMMEGAAGNISDFLTSGGMSDIVDAAMVGLLRVVSRFQSLFEEGGGGMKRVNSGHTHTRHQSSFDDTTDEGGSDAAGDSSSRRASTSSMGLLATVQDTAKAGRRPSTFSRAASLSAASMDDKDAGEDTGSGSVDPTNTAVPIQLMRSDLEVLTSLVDILTVAWSGGFLSPSPPPDAMGSNYATGVHSTTSSGGPPTSTTPAAAGGGGGGGNSGGSGGARIEGFAVDPSGGEPGGEAAVSNTPATAAGVSTGRHSPSSGQPDLRLPPYLVSTGGSGSGSNIGTGTSGGSSSNGYRVSRSASQSDFEAAFGALNLSPNAPLTMAAVGGFLRRASAALAVDSALMTGVGGGSSGGGERGTQQPRSRAASGFHGIPEGEQLQSHQSHQAQQRYRASSAVGISMSDDGRSRSGSIASECSAGDGDREGGGSIPNTATASSAGARDARLPPSSSRRGSGSGTPGASAHGSAHGSVHGKDSPSTGGGDGGPHVPPSPAPTARHRSTRTMAKEELQRSFQANPSIFDESTREYVASLVAPQGAPRSRGAAKERLRAGVMKVVRAAAFAKRLSDFTSSKPLIPVATQSAATGSGSSRGGGLSGVAADAANSSSSSGAATSATSTGACGTHGGVSEVAPAHGGSDSARSGVHSLDASGGEAAKRRAATKVDPMIRCMAALDVSALIGMEKWEFNIISANSQLLAQLSRSPSTGAPSLALPSPLLAPTTSLGGGGGGMDSASLGLGMPLAATPPLPPLSAGTISTSLSTVFRPRSTTRGVLVTQATLGLDPVSAVVHHVESQTASALTSPSGVTSPSGGISGGAGEGEAAAFSPGRPTATSASGLTELVAPTPTPTPMAAAAADGDGGVVVVGEKDKSGSSKFTDIADSGNGLGSEMLIALTSNALDQAGVIDDLSIDREVLVSFLARIARGYHNQPYHNALHGADVVQAMFYLLSTGGLGRQLSAEQRMAALLAAAVHDVGHPGLNNIYLSQTQHPLALTYNDRSPLENMHAATAFLTMRKPGCEVLGSVSPEQRSEIRAIIIDMILATDNAHHFKLIGRIRRRVARGMKAASSACGGGGGGDDDDYSSSDDGVETSSVASTTVTHPIDTRKPSDARLLLQTTLHACDISNPARQWEVYGNWTARITEEFWVQGDKLREHAIPVPPMHDRLKPIPLPNMQAGFMTALVLPLWTFMTEPVFKQIVDCSEIVKGLKTNLGRYTEMIEAAKVATAASARAP